MVINDNHCIQSLQMMASVHYVKY